jgi:hypothetical protein
MQSSKENAMKTVLKWSHYGLLCLAAVAALALALVVNQGIVLAQPAESVPQAAATPRATPDFTALENLLKREQIALANQAERIMLSDQLVTKTQQLISKLKAAGKDTASLETGLATFKQSLAETKTLHDSAAALLKTPAGFNAGGQVTEAKQAADTIHSAGQELRQAHLKITAATLDLRILIRNYVAASKK